MNILKMTILVLGLITISGCKKFLDKKSDAKLIVPSTITDLQGILDDAASMNLMRTPSYGESESDDFFLLQTTLSGFNQTLRDVYSWKKVDYRFGNDWSDAYLPIYNANLCLELLADIPRNDQNAKQWDNIKGSCLFFRSYYFYSLTTTFGLAYNASTSDKDLGVVLRQSSDFNIKSERATVKQCLERVLLDAEQSLQLLPDFADNTLRPSRVAAMALISRVNLYMGNYDKAFKYADDCLNLKSALMDYNSDPDILGLDLNIPFKKFNKETIFYAELNFGFSIHSTTRAKIDTILYGSYTTNDLRKRAYFRPNGLYQQFKGSYSSSSSTFFCGFATDEMYLNRAEARAALGDVDLAMADLNTLLKKRWKNTVVYIPITAIDKADALKKIKEERRKELIMRNIRWADLKRYNVSGANITLKRKINNDVFVLEPNSPFYALPLPIDIIEQTGMPQN